MRTLPALLCLMILTVPAAAQPLVKSPKDTTGSAHAVARARAAAGDLLSTLRHVLSQHLETGGLAHAITICADTAQVLTEQIASKHRVGIRRVSEKYRNPLDRPDSYEINVLRKFQRLSGTGALSDTVDHVDLVQEREQRELRLLTPIVIRSACLGCHGSMREMAQGVREVLEARYPTDRAVNYRLGDLRGVVSVRVVLE